MRALFAKIAAILASMPRMVMTRVLQAGEWVTKWVAQAPPAAAPDPVAEVAAVEQREADQGLAAIRTVAGMLMHDRIAPPELTGNMSDLQFEWLVRCDKRMWASIVAADDASLRAHVMGRRNIKGVLTCHPEALADHDRAQAADERVQAWKEEDQQEYGWPPAYAA